MMIESVIILAIWNGLVFFVYGIDKHRAKRGSRRIKEKTLVALAFLLGSVGAMFAMVVFNHKTSKIKFRVAVPCAVVLHAALIYALMYWLQI